MEELKKAKAKISELMEKVKEKESIDALSEINSELDKAEEKHTKLQSDRDELLEDYRKAVKNASSPDGAKDDGEGKKEFSFESFAEEYIKKNKEGEK